MIYLILIYLKITTNRNTLIFTSSNFKKKKNLSQENLAHDCNIPKSQIARIKLTKINTMVKTLIKIANTLEVEPKDLFDLKY